MTAPDPSDSPALDAPARVTVDVLTGVLRRALDELGLVDRVVEAGHLYNDPANPVIRVSLPFLAPSAVAVLMAALQPLSGRVVENDPTLVRMSVDCAGNGPVEVDMTLDVSPAEDVVRLVGGSLSRFERACRDDVPAAVAEFGVEAVSLALAGRVPGALEVVLGQLRRQLPSQAGQVVAESDAALVVLLRDRVGEVSWAHADVFQAVRRLLRDQPELIAVGRALDADLEQAGRGVQVPVREAPASPSRRFWDAGGR